MADGAEEWFCYVAKCRDGSLYLGIAKDPKERVRRHNWGVGPRFTALRRPLELIWSERLGSSEAARRREKEIKGWSREKKLKLARVNPSPAARAQGKKGE